MEDRGDSVMVKVKKKKRALAPDLIKVDITNLYYWLDEDQRGVNVYSPEFLLDDFKNYPQAFPTIPEVMCYYGGLLDLDSEIRMGWFGQEPMRCKFDDGLAYAQIEVVTLWLYQRGYLTTRALREGYRLGKEVKVIEAIFYVTGSGLQAMDRWRRNSGIIDDEYKQLYSDLPHSITGCKKMLKKMLSESVETA